MPMQPSPIAETSRLLSSKFARVHVVLLLNYSDLRDAMSIEKRYIFLRVSRDAGIRGRRRPGDWLRWRWLADQLAEVH